MKIPSLSSRLKTSCNTNFGFETCSKTSKDVMIENSLKSFGKDFKSDCLTSKSFSTEIFTASSDISRPLLIKPSCPKISSKEPSALPKSK